MDYLSSHLEVPIQQIATIGDQPNDVLMFKRSGLSIAMGNASDDVKKQAAATTDSYNDEGFAKAMERFILGASDRGSSMGEISGRFETLPDPVALTRRVAEWMTLAALAAKGTFRVSLSGGSTPKTLYRLSRLMSSAAVSPGSVSSGTGEMSASFPTTILTATIAWSTSPCSRGSGATGERLAYPDRRKPRGRGQVLRNDSAGGLWPH